MTPNVIFVKKIRFASKTDNNIKALGQIILATYLTTTNKFAYETLAQNIITANWQLY